MVLACAAFAACESPPSRTAPAESGAPAAASVAPVPSGHEAIATPGDAAPPAPCRVVSGEGSVTAAVDATAWVVLPERSAFTVRVKESGRELRFAGPGRVRACSEDMALVAEGRVVALPGAGDAPGNEQWVGTPCGAVRYAAGALEVVVTREGCRVAASRGTAWVRPSKGARVEDETSGHDAAASRIAREDDGWLRIDAGSALRVRAVTNSAREGECTAARAEEDAKARAVREGSDAGGTLGERTAEHVVARRRMRAACAAARTDEAGADIRR